ncbi:hypothetical protein SMSP2_02026 [Limihaloglobus sulfuriphilus]|uniref:Uncharacterized protein n=1 Tax=Limihaloglobus sulfuriphilus TaxID=1851148 RepID=A0A1Q2MG66_9BACT|nr:hypothetical protein [Limihaloglobus sulfuriphilus]AQQ71649.1 hypothetical protein SMSP2_02026 [Limihaloglobus sulfuriphilus]
MKRSLIFFLLSSLFCGLCRGEVAWLVRMDAERLYSSRLNDEFEKLAADMEDEETAVSEFLGRCEEELSDDLERITIYNNDYSSDGIRVLLKGDFDPKRLFSIFKSYRSYRTGEHDGKVLHQCVVDDMSGLNVYGAACEGWAVVSFGSEKVLETISQIEDKSLLKSFNQLNRVFPPEAMVAGVTRGLGASLAKKGMRDPVLSNLGDVIFTVSEAGDTVYFNCDSATASSRVAGGLKDAIMGTVAAAKMHADQVPPAVLKFFSSLNTSVSGDIFSVSFNISVDDFAAFIAEME